MSAESGWRCHAHPPAKKGQPCGNFNADVPAPMSATGMSRALYCRSCGCTKTASDARRLNQGSNGA